MKISKAQWDRYIKLTSALKGTARKKMDAYIAQHGISDMDAVIDYAYGIATKYGEGTSAIAAEMYDGIARAQGAKVPAAEPAPTASYKDTAKAVTYAKGRGQSLIPGAVETLVKQAGADTMLRNAARDGAEFAWVPHGSETCPMCLTIASNGWRRASKKTMKGDHADHIHGNCDCEFAIRFDGKSTVEGYDPDALREQYDNAEGSTWKDKVNFMRREQYKVSGDKIRAQKRAAYARRKELRQLDTRNMALGLRTPPDHKLTNEEIVSVKNDADEIRIPEGVLKFNQGARTGFSDEDQVIYVRGDVLPDTSSHNNRDLLSSRAVLAHEYYGHMKMYPSPYHVGDWRDEFRASYLAALNTPNLSDEDRARLMIDAFERGSDAGIKLRYNKIAREIIYGYD